MSGTVTLKHLVNRQPSRMFVFYDGLLFARDGLLTLPLDKMHWVQRAWMKGYCLSPDDKRLFTLQDVHAEIERQTAESAKEEDESSDSGRQPKPKNRVRAGQR